MPEAADSNSTSASGIHPATAAIEKSLDDLADIFQAYRVIIANTLAAGGDCKTPPDSLAATAAHIIEQFDRQKDNLKTLVRQFAMSAPAKVNRLKFKAVRDRFILELIGQGFSNVQIAQVLNLRQSFINRLTAELTFDAEKENTAA